MNGLIMNITKTIRNTEFVRVPVFFIRPFIPFILMKRVLSLFTPKEW